MPPVERAASAGRRPPRGPGARCACVAIVPLALLRELARTRRRAYLLGAISAAVGTFVWAGAVSATGAAHPLLILLMVGPLLASYGGGLGAGLLATLLTAAGAALLAPALGISWDWPIIAVSLTAFCAVGALGSWIGGSLHRAAARAAAEAAAARQHEEAREALAQRLRGIVQCEMLGIAFWSQTGEVSEPNDALLRLLGYTRDEVAAAPLRWMSMAPRAQLTRALRAFAEIRERGFCTPFETTFLRKDGIRVPVLVGGGSISSAPGSGAFFVFDMTQARQMAEALRASERRYRLVAESMHDVVSLLELDGRIVFVSPSVEDRLGWEPSQVVGHTLFEFVHPEERGRLEGVLREAATSGRLKPVIWRCRARNGAWHWLETHLSLLDGEAEGVVQLLCTSRDVTDRKNLEEQLRQAQRMEAIGRLAGGVAHDFNNLLTVILGYASHLEMELEPGAPGMTQAQEIREAAERATRLTQQLLAFSRQQVLQPRVVDLNDTVRSLTSMLQRLVGPQIRLELVLEDGLWTVLVDPGQIEQVFMNLVVNGRDAMPRGGRIQIRTRTERLVTPRGRQGVSVPAGDWTVFEVSDSGDGMPAAIVSRIFEPFFTTKALGQGTGLGLSMVYGIVKQSGGFIFCDSAPGAGTTMCVYLPRALAAVERSLPGTGTAAAHGGTVLVVEDEPSVRGLVAAVLHRAGYRLYEAGSGAEALAMLDRIPRLDLLVTDLVMPEMGGVEVARRVLEARPGTPVLYMSGYTDDVLQHEDVVPGASFIQKPFRPDVLMSKVRDVAETSLAR